MVREDGQEKTDPDQTLGLFWPSPVGSDAVEAGIVEYFLVNHFMAAASRGRSSRTGDN